MFLPNINHPQAAERAEKCRLLSLVTLTFDLQTSLSEGPNTSSLWIWHKSVQWFRRYFIHQKKLEQTCFLQTQTTRRPLKFTLTFKLVWTRDQTRLPSEFGANPFSSSRDISYTNKKSETAQKSANNRTLCCSPHAIKMDKMQWW